MRTHKQEWKTIGIPKKMYQRIENIIVDLGVPSVSEYVRAAVEMREKYDREVLEKDVD